MPTLHFDFIVVWKDGSYKCSGWFKNPRKYREDKMPTLTDLRLPKDFDLEGFMFNKFSFEANGIRFIPKPFDSKND